MEKRRRSLIITLLLCFVLLASSLVSEAKGDTTVYTWGSGGGTVKQIQQRLKLWNYYTGNISGVYDYETFNSVKEYQRSNNMEPTGIADESFLKSIGISASGADDDYISSENEIWLLASLIEAYGEDLPYHGKVAIGAVIINRTNNGSFPDTISSVIYQPQEFEGLKTPSEKSIEAARDAVNGFDPSNGALYFWRDGQEKNSRISTMPVIKLIGGVSFGIRQE